MFKLIKANQNTIIQVSIKLLALSLGILTTRWVNLHLVNQRVDLERILAVCNIFLALTGFGIPQLLYKAYSNKTQDLKDYWATVNILKIGLYFVSSAIIFLIFPLVNISSCLFLFGIYTAQYILASDLHFKSVSDTNGRSRFYSISDLCGKISSIIFLYVGILFFPLQSATVYVWAFVLANLFTLGLDAYFQRASTGWGKFRLDYLKKDLLNILICVLTSLFMTAYLRTLPLFMGDLSPNIYGSYGNSQKIIDLWCVIPAITMPVLVSKMYQNLKNNPTNKNKIFQKNILLVLSLGICLYLLANFTAPLVVFLIGGSKYTNTINILDIQSLILIIYPFLYFFGSYFLIIGKMKYDLFISIIVGTISLISMYFLNKFIGYNGLFIGLTIGYFGDFLVKTMLFIRNYNKTI
jgi:O-antigen/teichoic acid export membrane protein